MSEFTDCRCARACSSDGRLDRGGPARRRPAATASSASCRPLLHVCMCLRCVLMFLACCAPLLARARSSSCRGPSSPPKARAEGRCGRNSPRGHLETHLLPPSSLSSYVCIYSCVLYYIIIVLYLYFILYYILSILYYVISKLYYIIVYAYKGSGSNGYIDTPKAI